MIIVLCLFTVGSVIATDRSEDDDEPAARFPGILGTYSAGERTVTRRDADIAFVWGSLSPLQQLPEKQPFTVKWQGRLLVRSPGKFRFHAHLQGRVSATLAGQTILNGETPADGPAQWISGPEHEFEYGEHPVAISFASTGPSSRIKLYWSSEAFALEPIPASAFYLNDSHPELDLESKGRELFAAHRCNRCHQRQNEPLSPPGPDLTHVGTGLNSEWLESWLAGSEKGTAHRWMPEFGFSKDEATAIAAFLKHQSTLPKLPEMEADDNAKENAVAGRGLLLSMGCLACHTYDKLGTNASFGGGDLTSIGAKRSRGWLWVWLTDPKLLNADHQMPVFDWKDLSVERRQLVAFLAQSGRTDHVHAAKSETAANVVEQGRKLVENSRCAACHRINGFSSQDIPKASSLNEVKSGPDSCLQPNASRQSGRPGFPGADFVALTAFLKSRQGSLSPEGPMELGQRLFLQNNCFQCHPRDGVRGLAAHSQAISSQLDELNGQVALLVPPALNAIGDKLLDDSLSKAVAGEFKVKRLSWLKVRMPRFSHSAEDRRALTQFFINHDRIESPPTELFKVPATPSGGQHEQALSAGHTLLGSRGFSCIACHQVGGYKPPNTALGTRGSDLLMMGQRMRRDYFFRWMKSPIRIVPDTEMPGYERPLPNLIDGRIETQLAALWAAVNDSTAARSLDISSLQQSLVVRAGEPARIVRDVFFIPKQDPKRPAYFVPRSLAVGLNTQHNILFDADRLQIIGWWQGDLARQRTEGKSWSWEIGGSPNYLSPTPQSPDRDLAFAGSNRHLSLTASLATAETYPGQIVEYGKSGNGVRLAYWLTAPKNSGFEGRVQIVEEWQPLVREGANPRRGWSRKIAMTGKRSDPGITPVFVKSRFNAKNVTLELPLESGLKWEQVEGVGEAVRLPMTGGDSFTINLHYLADVVDTPSVEVVPNYGDSAGDSLKTVPGHSAQRLPLPRSIMPTALTWTKNGTLAFTSLKGHVYIARDSDGDGLEDKLEQFEEGLAAPYGIIGDPLDDSLIVSHKPELLRLIDTDGDGRADLRKVVATGWGYNDNYHDWTCGIVRDSKGNLYVGLGSDYTQPNRPVHQQKWRGKVLKIGPTGYVQPIASGLRYPTGLALTPDDDLFVSDNQGEQNVFNELNHIVEGARYGVPSREDPRDAQPATTPAIQIPHPWTRSVNGIFFLPRDLKWGDNGVPHPFAGHGIGCEYDSRFLVRFTLQKMGDTFQGAIYPFSQNQVPVNQPNFEPILCGGVSPRGDIYVGCTHDSGWLGGLNVGSLVRIRSTGKLPVGIRELTATKDGFQIEFTAAVNPQAAGKAENYAISAYTRKWQGTYATADSNRHEVPIQSVSASADQRTVQLKIDSPKVGYVYEVSCGKIGTNPDSPLWPATGHYTLNRLPE